MFLASIVFLDKYCVIVWQVLCPHKDNTCWIEVVVHFCETCTSQATSPSPSHGWDAEPREWKRSRRAVRAGRGGLQWAKWSQWRSLGELTMFLDCALFSASSCASPRVRYASYFFAYSMFVTLQLPPWWSTWNLRANAHDISNCSCKLYSRTPILVYTSFSCCVCPNIRGVEGSAQLRSQHVTSGAGTAAWPSQSLVAYQPLPAWFGCWPW